jgi:hypothetical protein
LYDDEVSDVVESFECIEHACEIIHLLLEVLSVGLSGDIGSINKLIDFGGAEGGGVIGEL